MKKGLMLAMTLLSVCLTARSGFWPLGKEIPEVLCGGYRQVAEDGRCFETFRRINVSAIK